MTEAHAFLAPSSASDWGPGGCPAFPRMAKAFPEDANSIPAQEGEAAHHYVHAASVATYAPKEGDVAPNGFAITAEMIECAQPMVRDVQMLLDRGTAIIMEQRVYMPQVHPMLNWGRVDLGGADFTAKVLYAWDYKFGHRYVDVFECWQLVDYVIGIANNYGIILDDTWTIDAAIYQPRSFHGDGTVKRWTPKGGRILELGRQLHEAALLATNPNAPYKTGPQCDFCPGRFACPALHRLGGDAMERSLIGLPHNLTPQGAGLALRHVRAARERLEALETGLEEQIYAAVRGGNTTTGWEVYQGYGREKWTVPASEVIEVGKAMGKELAKPPEAITPAQARKLGLDAEVVKAISTTPKGEMKLRPLDDKQIRKAFA